MAKRFRILGRMTRRAVRSQAVQQAVASASVYIVSELQLADIKLRIAYLKRKREDHLHLLGRTAYRLHKNDVDPAGNENIDRIMTVLREIDSEIAIVEQELAARIEQKRREKEQRRNASCQPEVSLGAEQKGKNWDK